MATYNISMKVEYIFEVEAEDEQEAEKLAWEYDYEEDRSSYAGVYSIDVEEVEEYYVDESETVGEGKDE
jgi:hypothetical protein